MNWILWILVAGIELGLVILLVVQNRILHRLGRLTRAVERIGASGDFASRVEVTGRDELGRLESSINGMLDDLQRAHTAERHSQQLYQSMMDNLPVGVSLRDRHLALVAANPRLREWFPVIREDTAVLHKHALHHPPARPGETPHPCEVALREKRVQEREVEIPVHGETRTFEVIATPVLDAEGEVANVLELMVDITERERLRARMQRLERLQAMGTLAAGVAHEINTPLNVMQLHASALEMRLEDGASVSTEDIGRGLRAIAGQVNRVSEIVRHMRALARQEEDPGLEPVPAGEAVRQALDLVSTQLGEHDVALELDLADDLPAVRANRLQLEQVLLNLVVNAMHAMDAAGSDPRRVTIAARRRGEEVRLTVRDTGPGLGEDADKIFDPFYTTKGPDQGTGLGLSLVHAFVTAWGGEIAAENAPGGGALFVLRLRKAGASEGNPAADPAGAPAEAS